MNRFTIGMSLLSFALLTGCDRSAILYSELDERQANEVIAALVDDGIVCHKSAGEEGRWIVEINEREFGRAISILDRKGLPRRKRQGVAEAFKRSGMVSSPNEERIRFMDALAQDISDTLAQIEGVVDARVHVVLPENDPFAKDVRPSSAAVSIRHRYDVEMSDYVPQIKSLVMNSIEGLDYGKITVTLFRDPPPRKAEAKEARYGESTSD